MLKVASIFVFVLLATLFALSLLTYSFFWYETANSSYLLHLRRLSRDKPVRLVLRGILSGFRAMILVVVCFPIGFRRRLWTPEPDAACSLPPILFIHGLYHNTSAWTFYRWWFRRAGFNNIYAWGYSSWKYSFDDLIEMLKRRVESIAELFPGNPPVLIGHSLGGLLSRAYVESYGSAKDVAAVVTLGAPHQGSKLAVLGVGKLARSLKYQGALINKLEQQPNSPDIPCIAVYSPVDSMVLPPDALHVAHPGWTHHELYPTSHVGMLFSRDFARWLTASLMSMCKSSLEGRQSG